MENIVNIFVKATFIDNMIFAYFLGMCSFLAVSRTVKTARGLGIAVAFVTVITVPINYLLLNYVLKAGALSWLSPSLADVNLEFLSFVMFVSIIAGFTQVVEMFIEKYSPALYSSLGIFLPLLAVNCAIMGASLFMQEREFNSIGEATAFALGSGAGWWLAIISLAAIREKMSYSQIPVPLRGLGIAFITTGLMAIAFMSFMGIQI